MAINKKSIGCKCCTSTGGIIVIAPPGCSCTKVPQTLTVSPSSNPNKFAWVYYEGTPQWTPQNVYKTNAIKYCGPNDPRPSWWTDMANPGRANGRWWSVEPFQSGYLSSGQFSPTWNPCLAIYALSCFASQWTLLGDQDTNTDPGFSSLPGGIRTFNQGSGTFNPCTPTFILNCGFETSGGCNDAFVVM